MTTYLTLKRGDTDPVLEYPVIDTDEEPVDFTGATVKFTMAAQTALPAEQTGTGDGVKASGIIQITDFTFDANDSITLGSTEFVANDGIGGGWAAGAGTIEAARDALYAVIDAASEPVTIEKAGTDSIFVTHTNWDEDVGNTYVFTETDGVTDNITLDPFSGVFDGGTTPDQMTITFEPLDNFVQILSVGDTVRIEYPSSTERITVADIDYQTGDVVFDRGDDPSSYYPENATVWFLKIDKAAGGFGGDNKNVLEYEWSGTDTNKSGTFYCEFEVTKSTGKIETYPSTDQLEVEIYRDIDRA